MDTIHTITFSGKKIIEGWIIKPNQINITYAQWETVRGRPAIKCHKETHVVSKEFIPLNKSVKRTIRWSMDSVVKQTKWKMYAWSFLVFVSGKRYVFQVHKINFRRLQSSFPISGHMLHIHTTRIAHTVQSIRWPWICGNCVCVCKYDIHQHIWIWIWIHLNWHVCEFLCWKIKLNTDNDEQPLFFYFMDYVNDKSGNFNKITWIN